MKRIDTSLALMVTTVLALASPALGAPNTVKLSDLSGTEGIWKSEFNDAEGNDRVAYDMRWLNEPYQVMRHVRVTVNPKTKTPVEMWAGFVKVDPSQQQFEGLYFSTAGWVGETSGVPTDNGHVIHVSITGTNRSRFHMTVHERRESDTAFTSSSKSILYGGRFIEGGEVQRFTKVDQTFRELMDNGAIVFEEVAEPIEALAPLSRLLGRWQSADRAGTTSHDLRWSLRMDKKWLIERWRVGGESGSGGFNVSGVDPATGMLTLWSISSDFMGKIGRWDVISDTVLGQVQGDARLIREFPDPDTFKAHWQIRRAGSFVDVPADQAEPYTVKRVSAQD